MTATTPWDAAFDAVVAARSHLSKQQARDRRVNKRRDQLDKRLLDCEMTLAWLCCMARDETADEAK